MCRGFHLADIGTERLDWQEFKIFVEHLPPVRENALHRARYPNSWNWTVDTELLAMVLHAAQGANWQRSGGEESDRPELISRPVDGEVQPREPDEDEGVPLDEIREELQRRREALQSR